MNGDKIRLWLNVIELSWAAIEAGVGSSIKQYH